MTDDAVFLSYRRADSAGYAGRLGDDLSRRFGASAVFRDVESIAAGSDFVAMLERAVARARVVLVLIGPDWVNAGGDGHGRRIDHPDDHVRREVELALEDAGVVVVPVLFGGATVPDEAALPPSLRRLSRLQAVEMSDRRWDYDLAQLEKILEGAGVRPGVRRGAGHRPLLAAAAALGAATLAWWLWSNNASTEHYTGLWHLPDGGFWSVVERDHGLWVEESHFQTQQVWKRGRASLDGGRLRADLRLVYDEAPFSFQHELALSGDRRSLIGSMRRSDRDTVSTLVLTRDRVR